MVTIKGYWEDAYIREFTAKIIAIKPHGIILDKTYFHPSGGNQPGDTGLIKSLDGTRTISIIDTCYENDEIIHVFRDESLFQAKEQIKGVLNWERRYALMRAHTSQHVLSSIFNLQYGLQTTNALILPHDVTIYLSNSLSSTDLKQSLLAALEICCEPTKSYQVVTHILPREKALDLYTDRVRGNIPEKNSIRLVKIGHKDINCCSGTHVKNTNEIGPFSIISFKGSEIRYHTGPAGLNELTSNSLEALNIRQILSGASGSLITHFRRLKDDRDQKKMQLEQLAPIIMKNAINEAINITNGVLILMDASFVSRKFFMSLLGDIPSNALIASIVAGPALFLYSNIESLSAKEYMKLFCEKTGAKGGGNPRQAQGAVKGIENPLNILKNIIIEKVGTSSNLTAEE
ncbi:MAG: alanine--tRNA ligase-related protein [Candidatus Hodarchaeota archaeon]